MIQYRIDFFKPLNRIYCYSQRFKAVATVYSWRKFINFTASLVNSYFPTKKPLLPPMRARA